MLLLTIYGVPVAKGSMKAFMRPGMRFPIVTHDSLQTKPWQQQVSIMAKIGMSEGNAEIIRRPNAVRVQAEFYFARPQRTKKTVNHKTTKPDVEKLARNLLDALTGICYEDDAQVAECSVSKAFDETPRSVVRVSALEEDFDVHSDKVRSATYRDLFGD
jgi:crossover junction endodeoxyribonuclease RusA